MTGVKVDITNAEEQVEAFERALEQAVADGNPAKIVERYYAPDARFMANHAPIAVGTDAIRRAMEGMVAQGVRSLKLDSTTFETEGSLAWNTGTYRLTIATRNGDIEDVGKYVTLFRKQPDGRYKCIVDCFNSDLPLPSH